MTYSRLPFPALCDQWLCGSHTLWRDPWFMDDNELDSQIRRSLPRDPRKHHLHLSLSRRTQLLSTILLVASTALIVWTIFLGMTLPRKYDAGHWDLLWTGFDIGLFCVLGYAAWAAWFRRQVLATTAIVAGTLLLCDAWFDVITSIGHRDQWLTLLTGFGGELPLAVFFFWLYRRIVLDNLAAFHQLLGDGPPPRRLRDVEILRLATRPEATEPEVSLAQSEEHLRGNWGVDPR